MNVHVVQVASPKAHALWRIVHAANEYGLITHENAALEEQAHRFFGDPRDLFRRVEMGVQHDVFAELAPSIDNGGKRVEPFGMRDDFHRHDRGAFGRKAHPAHVGEYPGARYR